jgi:serine/threonine protein kinase
MAENSPGTPELIFGKYEILERLAVGGMGEVFFAAQRSEVRGFERPVILKSLLPDLAQQEDFIEQFLDEARVASTLNHPNVVSIHEVGLWNGVYFIAMEFIRGRNLSQIVKLARKQQKTVPYAVTARIIRDAALGLAHAHSANDAAGHPLNIVHRDISPQNIMVRDDGVTKVVDFGIARASNRSTRTATGTVKGKMAYMAPEQLRLKTVTGAADQFSLGVVLWEMSAGRRLFLADQEFELAMKVLEGPIPTLLATVGNVPGELNEITMRMLERNPDKRFATCADVAKELDEFCATFSPRSSESPVATYMKELGVDDLAALTPRVTPSSKNFIIDLKARAELIESPTTPQRGSARGSAPHLSAAVNGTRFRRWPWFAGSIALAALLIAGLVVSRSQPSVPAPVVPPVAVVQPPEKAPKKQDDPAQVPRVSRLSIRSAPDGAKVSVNGSVKGVAPLTWEGEPGEITVAVDLAGFMPQQRQVNV